MPVKLQHLCADRRTLHATWGDDTVTIVYRPGAMTAAFEARLRGMSDDPNSIVPLVELLAEVLDSWDVLDDTGVPLPTSREVLAEVPARFLLFVAQQIGADQADPLALASPAGT